jgi:hypothetical protein
MPEQPQVVPPNEELLRQHRETYSREADGSVLLKAVLDMKEAQGETRATLAELRSLVQGVQSSSAENKKKLDEVEGLVRALDKKLYAASVVLGIVAALATMALGQLLAWMLK